jgi:hypothetical protein
MSHWDFPATEPIDLLVEVAAGSVRITAEQTETVSVDVRPTKSGPRGDELADVMQVDFTDGRLEIVEPRHPHNWIRSNSGLDVRVTLPTGSLCSVSTASADVRASGELGSLNVKTASGAIRAEAVTGECDVNSMSGRVAIDEAASRVSAKSASGAIEIGRVGGDLDVNNVSGKVEIGKAEAGASVKTASGRVRIGLAHGQAEVVTVSGDVKVYVAKGTGVYLDMTSLTGRVTSELEPSEASDQVDLHLRCRSVSGAIKVARAELADVS